ncbi:hypothetical protein F7725_009662 [Dissostichus mawsoni]|uniref:Uncharacterized protein n=1 Tax=Dissostichus mawsoni TaxID=36200 RepID=A0A7J5XLD7_DISMA|nr:hypothetical protein F7725_009662 [Dissostichus mawsoni]
MTGRQHKLVIPAGSPDKEFVLLVGASHLRSIVDGIVKMPEGRFSFGAMSTPGACATQLRTEAANAVLPRTPDAVCVMAPSNNLTSSRTITEAGEDFAKLLATACSRWPNVFAMDFPPRLTVDPDYQDMMRQEFRRVAARVKYTPIAEYFPSKELDLWSRDGVHLSDSAGMPILVGSIWNATYMQLVPAEPKPSPVVHRRSPPARRVTPRVIVKGEVAKSPQLDPSKWTVFGQGRKRSQHDEPEQSIDALKQAGTVQQEELEESYLPLTPVWFSSAMLVEMDKISPSHLPGPDECTPPVPKRQKKAKQRAPASKRTLAKRQGEAAPMVVEVIVRPPTSRGTVAVEQQVSSLKFIIFKAPSSFKVILIYRPPKPHPSFLSLNSSKVTSSSLLFDLNMTMESPTCELSFKFSTLIDNFTVTQHFTFPTHAKRHILDLVFY